MTAALATGLIAGATSTADASFEGTPGKVAYLDGGIDGPLKIWDPVTEGATTIEPTTFEPGQTGTTPGPLPTEINAGGRPSAPVWSPDGTKLAYSKMIADQGDIIGLEHSAIFVYDVSDGSTTQVTTPPDAVWDSDPANPPQVGRTVADWSPIWSGDGNQIAFVRLVAAFGTQDTLYEKRGQNLWIAPATGGSATQVTTFRPESSRSISGGVWIPETQDLVVSYHTGNFVQPAALGRLSSGGGTPQFLAGSATEAIVDYDVSPDGTKLAFNSIGPGGVTPFVQPLSGPDAGVAVSVGNNFGAILRFSGSGDGLLHSGCTTRNPRVCGLLTRLTDDPAEADIKPGELDRLALAWDEPVPGAGGIPARTAFDVQPQTLPIVYVPGFLGSKIQCAGRELWPSLPAPRLLEMRLDASGLNNAGCAAAGPSGELVETALGQDVYGPAAEFLREEFPGRAHLFGWDWRRRPLASLVRLDDTIDQALDAPGEWKDQGAGRVVLMGHSYGGLLIRTYLDQHPERVARTVSFGTPYFGAPKAIFPLLYGVETPQWGLGLDIFLDNTELKQFAVNLAGAYQLYPSNRHTSGWLRYDGVAQPNADSVVGLAGGNVALARQARGYHSAIYEGFDDNGERIDTRTVVGTGLATFDRISIVPRPGDDDLVGIFFAGGDGTVPATSAGQGPVAAPPLGDPIHVQYTCNISHVTLGGAEPVLAAYKDWIDFGRTPRKLPPPCPTSGGYASFEPGTLGAAPPLPSAARSARTGSDLAAASDPLSLADAEAAELIDLVTLPGQVLAVTSDVRPVNLRFTITNGTFTWTRFSEQGSGRTFVYGPLNGTVELSSTVGGTIEVTVDGVAVSPQGGGVAPAPGGVAPAPSGVAPAPIGGDPPGAGSPSPSNAFSPGKPKRNTRKGTATLVVTVPGPGTLTLTGKGVRSQRSAATAAKTVAGHSVKLLIKARGKAKRKLNHAGKAKVEVTLTYTPTGGTPNTQTKVIKLKKAPR